jgi:uncharacterized membrane protein YdjX (TVP38/TMEM64 family)
MSLSGRLAGGLALLCVLLGGAVAAYGLGSRFDSAADMADWLRGSGAWAPLMVIALMVLHSFIPFPAEILALCAGAVFGTVLGSALIWCGAMLGALVAFALARHLGQKAVEAWLSESRAAELRRWTGNHGALALLAARLVPVIAFNLINYAAGLTPVRLWTFTWTTALGILPVTVLCCWLGAEMRAMSWPLIAGVSAACLVALGLLHRLARRYI